MERSELLRRLARVLSEDELAAAAADLERLEAAGATPHWLGSVLDAADYLLLPDVPPVVSQNLRRIFSGPKLPAHYRAVLVRDSRTDRQLAGVRGDTSEVGWSLSFTSEIADLVVDVWPADQGGEYTVEGQVMPLAAESSAYRAVVRGQETTRVDGDSLGRFRIGALAPGRYDLVVGDGDIEIEAQLDLDEIAL